MDGARERVGVPCAIKAFRKTLRGIRRVGYAIGMLSATAGSARMLLNRCISTAATGEVSGLPSRRLIKCGACRVEGILAEVLPFAGVEQAPAWLD